MRTAALSFIRFAPVLALPLLAACGDATAEAAFSGSVDTLANGAVHVKNPAAGMWKEGEGWRLVEELRIGREDGTGPDVFGQIAGLEVDAAGRIYVLEQQAKEIRVFGPDGAHVRSIGRDGAGPGEFRGPNKLFWDAQGLLWVADQPGARFSAFDTAGAFVTSKARRATFSMVPWPGGMDAQGAIYDVALVPTPVNPFSSTLVRLDSAMAPADTFAMPRFDEAGFDLVSSDGSSRTRMSVPFSPRLVFRLERDGNVWWGTTDAYRIVTSGFGGDTLRIVERAYEPVPVSAAERDSAYEALEPFRKQGGKTDISRFPAHRPAFDSFALDGDGYLWVAPVTAPGGSGQALDVFDPDGRYLGRVDAPERILSWTAPVIRGAHVHAVVRDELDIPYVVRYRIEGRGR